MLIVCCYFSLRAEGPKENSATSCATKSKGRYRGAAPCPGQEPFWNGKEMTLILDHINGYRKDDRLENLRWVCPNCNQQLDTTGSKNPNRKMIAKKYYCVDCGKEIFKGSTRCIECESNRRIISLDKMPITREELKNLIRTLPFTQIGKKYNVPIYVKSKIFARMSFYL